MERGLLWLPLLAIFVWLAWAGQYEYQKVEAYKSWAKDFERHKYDIHAVLGQKGDYLIWGTPTPKNPINLKTIRFSEIHKIQLKLNQSLYDEIPLNLTTKVKNISIELNADSNLNIQFTDLELANSWYKYLRNNLSAHLL